MTPIKSPPSSASFPWRQLWRQATTRYIGIDVGAAEVRVCSIGPSNPDGPSEFADPLQWFTRTRFELPVDPFAVPEPGLVETFCETLMARLPRCVDGDRDVAAIALPVPWVHYETAASNDVATAQAHCDAMFENSVFGGRAHLCHWPIDKANKRHVVAATSASAACQVAHAVASVGYDVQTVLPHGVALVQVAPEICSVDPAAVVLLEVHGGIVATNPGGRCGLCRSLPAFDGPAQPAPQFEQLEPWLPTIAEEIVATLRYVERLGQPPADKRPILICGDVAKIPGVDVALASLIGHNVATWRYSRCLRPVGPADPSDDVAFHDPSRAVSLSLAFCAAHLAAGGSR